jgi:predicted dinucleotide-binding enzyme
MKIAILGTGHIGSTLGKKWVKAGYTVRFGARDPNKTEVKELVTALGENASASRIAEAIDFGEIVIFAVPGQAMDETITSNAKALDGKIIVDSANKIGAPIINSFATFAAQTPKARVYRAFNIYGWENFDKPAFYNVSADLFYCGPDGEARSTMEKLISAVGLNPVYLGGPEQAEQVDNILKLWFTLAVGQKKGRHMALKVMTR